MSRVVASIEARMNSSRLPNKVMADIAGRPAIDRIVGRLRRSRRIDDIVLATTTGPSDDVLRDWAETAGVACYRGSQDDVLGRVVEAHRLMGSDVVVEVCGDTPVLDPDIIDRAVAAYRAGNGSHHVVSNTWKPSFPQGLDAQVFGLRDLEDVARTVDDPAVREHVSLHFYENPQRYRILHLEAPPRWRRPDIRLQLDYEEDLALVSAIYERLEPKYGLAFGIQEILDLLEREPALAAINRHCQERPVRSRIATVRPATRGGTR